ATLAGQPRGGGAVAWPEPGDCAQEADGIRAGGCASAGAESGGGGRGGGLMIVACGLALAGRHASAKPQAASSGGLLVLVGVLVLGKLLGPVADLPLVGRDGPDVGLLAAVFWAAQV